VEFSFNNVDKKAAWEMYVELLTRITTQRLAPEDGDEKTALDSVFSLFEITRSILKSYGPDAIEFAKIAIIVLNQIIRPFTAKWHKKSLAGAFEDSSSNKVFREELTALQEELRKYTKLLSDIAGVEDLTELEKA
ncbi:MAG: hypothetical protein AAFO07_02230, partial [Bacteroidota bacterium]